jgi:hypothetical protein
MEQAAAQNEYIVGVGDGSASVRKKDKYGEILLSVDLNIPGRNTDGELSEPAYIQDFYVLPRRNTGTREYAGQGKKALCFLINKLVSDGVLKEKDAIQLDAKGSQRPLAAASASEPPESLESLQTYLKDYPTVAANLFPPTQLRPVKVGRRKDWKHVPVTYTDEEKLQKMRDKVTAIRANRKLIAYYETYGFKVVPGKDEGVTTKMTGTVGEILKACDPTGAARKKTRRRRRTQRTRRYRNRGF